MPGSLAMQRIDLLDGAYLELWPHWLAPDEASALVRALRSELPWEARAIRVFGREVMQPRLVAWIGDPEAVYTCSGVRHEPKPWTPRLLALRARLRSERELAFNSVLCNLYRDGRDSMGLHRDAEPELGPDPVVASLSLGATRRFQLRHRHPSSPARGSMLEHAHKLDLDLASGSLLIMRGTTQRHYRHGVPKAPALTEPRINLTFRLIIA